MCGRKQKAVVAAFLGLILVFASFPLRAATYRYQDEKGVIHFTDDRGRIPAEYREKAELVPEENRTDGFSPALLERTALYAGSTARLAAALTAFLFTHPRDVAAAMRAAWVSALMAAALSFLFYLVVFKVLNPQRARYVFGGAVVLFALVAFFFVQKHGMLIHLEALEGVKGLDGAQRALLVRLYVSGC
jgi:hypothetical protein